MRHTRRSIGACAGAVAVAALLLGALPAAAQTREVKVAPNAEQVKREKFIGPKELPTAREPAGKADPYDVRLREPQVQGQVQVQGKGERVYPLPLGTNEAKTLKREALAPEENAALEKTRREKGEARATAARAIGEEKRAEHQKVLETKKAEFEAKRLEEKKGLVEKAKIIRDEKKRALVVRLDEGMNALNTKMVNLLGSTLVKIEKVLERVGERIVRVAESGADVGDARSAITGAEGAIAAARTALAAQVARTYGVTITSEATLQGDFGSVRQVLMRDLIRVREVVKEAHEAVRRVAVILAQTSTTTTAASSGVESTTNQ